MNKPIRVILINDAKNAFEALNKTVGEQINKGKENSEEIQLLKSIKQKIELIKKNPFYGNNIQKKLIPKEYKLNNLWRIELTHYWRMLYTIKGDQIEVICFVLDILNHKKYNKKFGYK